LDKEQGQEITKKLEKLGSNEDEMIYLSDVSDHDEENNSHNNDDNNHNDDNDSNDNTDNNNNSETDKNNNHNVKQTTNTSTKKKDNNDNLTVNECGNEGVNAENEKK